MQRAQASARCLPARTKRCAATSHSYGPPNRRNTFSHLPMSCYHGEIGGRPARVPTFTAIERQVNAWDIPDFSESSGESRCGKQPLGKALPRRIWCLWRHAGDGPGNDLSIITISEQHGSRGDKVAGEVAHQLGFTLVTPVKIDEIIREKYQLSYSLSGQLPGAVPDGQTSKVFANLISAILTDLSVLNDLVVLESGGQFIFRAFPECAAREGHSLSRRARSQRHAGFGRVVRGGIGGTRGL